MADKFPNVQIGSDWMNSPDTLWLNIQPKIFELDTIARGGHNKGPFVESPIQVMMPNDYTYSLTHEWKPLNTVTGALRDLKSEVTQQIAAGGQIAGQAWGSLAQKNDSPMIYEDTPRLAHSVKVELSYKTDAKKDVYDVIQKIVTWSTASMGGGGASSTDIDFPYVFQLKTITGDGKSSDILNVNDAAITSIIPTYSHPYIKGYPCKATVDIVFLDLEPLYRSSFGASRITSSNG